MIPDLDRDRMQCAENKIVVPEMRLGQGDVGPGSGCRIPLTYAAASRLAFVKNTICPYRIVLGMVHTIIL